MHEGDLKIKPAFITIQSFLISDNQVVCLFIGLEQGKHHELSTDWNDAFLVEEYCSYY